MQVDTLLLSKLMRVSGYQPKKQRVKDHNGNFLAWVENGTLKMTSYGHWSFFQVIDGVYVFNDYSYSHTTSRHQSTGRALLRTLGITNYVEYSTRSSLGYVSLNEILDKKIKSLYLGENALSTSKATKYAPYSESSWNDTMSEIKMIQAALKMSDKKLNDMMLEAETKASESLLNELVDAHERQLSRREAVKSIQSLAAIQL